MVAIEAVVAEVRDAFNASDNGQFARYEVTEVRFLRPDVALGHVTVTAATESGEPLRIDHSMRSLFVLTKEDGRWVVAARQDTIVAV
ncbi:SgcJ/EcaC family oxidoreductase [Actinophytocola sediminis]